MTFDRHDRRTALGAIVAFFVGLLLGQQEKAPDLGRFTMTFSGRTTRNAHQQISNEEMQKALEYASPYPGVVVRCDFPLEPVFLDDDGNVKSLSENRDAI